MLGSLCIQASQMSAPRSVVTAIGLCLMGLALFSFLSPSGPVSARTLPTECGSFSDDPLGTSTPVKAVHLSELRSCVNALRGQAGLAAATWTDGTLISGSTPVKAVHITELRSALDAVYSAYAFPTPTYTDSTLSAGSTTIKRAHVSELRTAAVALDLPSAAPPSFSPTPGTFNASQNVTLSSTTSGAVIRFTLDGSEPTIASSLYESPIALNAITTVRAKTFAAGNLPSTLASGAFTFQVAAPTFSPPAGTYQGHTPVQVSSSTPSVEFRYTLDGSEPTAGSQLYGIAIDLYPTSTTTIKVKGYRSGWVP
jgi:hypothetical protein